MKQALLNLCLVLVLISNRYYVNTDRIDFIDLEEKWIKIGPNIMGHASSRYWYLNVTDQDIETLKRAMGTFGK